MLFPAENFIAKNGIIYTLRSPELADGVQFKSLPGVHIQQHRQLQKEKMFSQSWDSKADK